MDDLAALAVAADGELGLRALRESLLDELEWLSAKSSPRRSSACTHRSQVLASGQTPSNAVVRTKRWVIVHTLNGNILSPKSLVKSIHIRRADNVAQIRVLIGASGEDQRERLADAIEDIVAGVVCTSRLDIGATCDGLGEVCRRGWRRLGAACTCGAGRCGDWDCLLSRYWWCGSSGRCAAEPAKQEQRGSGGGLHVAGIFFFPVSAFR